MASETSMSEGSEKNDRTPDSNPGPSNDSTVRKNAERWKRKGKGAESTDGRRDSTVAGSTSSSAQAEVLREERLRMVIHQIYGTQAHYQAAQKFLKNRTLRKMNNQNGMTLYDRIMAYRRLKEGEEPEQGVAVPVSPKQPAEPQLQTTKRRSTSSASNKGKAPRDSPGQRPASSSRSIQHLDRSDTSFASVDISDLTQLDEEKNRTPSPQPTFEDRPYKQEQRRGHDYEAQATARDVHVQLHDTEERVTERRVSSAVERSAITTATVAVAARAHTSNADSHSTRQEHKEKVEKREVHKEKSENKEEHKVKSENIEEHKVKSEKEVEKKSEKKEVREDKYENKATHKEKIKRKDSEEDVRKEKRDENIVEKTATAVVVAKAVNESSKQERSERKENKDEEDKHKSSSKQETAEKKENVHKEEHTSSSTEERSEKKEKDEEENHTSKKKHTEKTSKEETIKDTVTSLAVSESVKEKETSDEKHEDKISEKETTAVSKSESRKNSSERSSSRSSKKEKNIVEQASDTLEVSMSGSGTPEPSKTPEAPAVETAASPVAVAAPVAAAAAASAPAKPKKPKSRAKSARKKAKEEEDNNTIAALDKLADKNLNSLLGNDDGGEDPDIDQQTLDKVFSPTFQAELDNFLHST